MDNSDIPDDLFPPHLAWSNYLLMYRAALSKYDCTEALTTDQVLAKLNAITFDEGYNSGMLFGHLLIANFKNQMLDSINTFVWLTKPVDKDVL